MNELHLTVLLLLSSVLGLALLYHATLELKPEQVSISELLKNPEKWLGKKVTVHAIVVDRFNSNKATFFTLRDAFKELKAVHFSRQDSLFLRTGKAYAFTGEFKSYKGELELIVSEVK